MVRSDVSGVVEVAICAQVPAPAHMVPPLLSQEVSVDGGVLSPHVETQVTPTDIGPDLEEQVV